MALFGTDGVRGVAGEFLTADLALRLGRAATLTVPAEHPQVLIVRDTRESGEMLEAALAAGIAAGGGHALLGGVLPTPGASVLVRRYGLDLAAVVSASHNPYRDNGIKFFGPEGMKIERRAGGRDRAPARRAEQQHRPPARAARRRRRLPARAGAALLVARPERACASCSTARTAPPTAWRRRSSAAWARRSTTIAVEPDGRNINEGVGSTHIEALIEPARGPRRRHSPSTATATACWRWTATAPWSTGTS